VHAGAIEGLVGVLEDVFDPERRRYGLDVIVEFVLQRQVGRVGYDIGVCVCRGVLDDDGAAVLGSASAVFGSEVAFEVDRPVGIVERKMTFAVVVSVVIDILTAGGRWFPGGRREEDVVVGILAFRV